MTLAAAGTRVSEFAERYAGLVDDLQALDQDAPSADEVLDLLRVIETQQRRLAPVQHAAIGQLDTRSVAFERGAKDTKTLLRLTMRISPADAHARVQAARQLGARRTVTGLVVEPEFPVLAAAQAAGTISAQHARVVTGLIGKLPFDVLDTRRDDAGQASDSEGGETDGAEGGAETIQDWIEQHLAEMAAGTDPTALDHHARDLRAVLDQSGVLREYERRVANRALDWRVRTDGSSTIHGELTPEATEHLLSGMDTLARPAPEADGVKDPRTPSQRRHDGFVALMKLVERAKLLPDCAGVSSTIVLTMDADTYAASGDDVTDAGATSFTRRTTGSGGMARTGHGYRVPAVKAKEWAGAEARIIAVLLSKTKGIEAYSTTHRLATEQQRLALLARDKGCIAPGCDAPPQWTEAHHVHDWKDTKRTCVDDLALLCSANHRDLPRAGYEIHMIEGRPWLVPPPWIDPERTPIRNTLHD